MNTRRFIPLLVAGALALSAVPASAATTLNGTVGPGFDITLTKGGQKVTSLKAGSYTFKITDKSAIHNYVLNGPGVKDKEIAGLTYQGTKSTTVTLAKGTYVYYCTPHKSMMKGSFTVS
ncbi:MAG: plastocyanin/azurin family copper-binding protein [Thermoleophilia bacterium]